MDLDLRQFEKRIVESQIVDPYSWPTMIHNFESESDSENLNPENIAHWLCKQKVISQLQANILINESNPRLQYGNYQIVDRLLESEDQYLSLHRVTGHPVLLTFLSGSGSEAIERWRTAKTLTTALFAKPHANLLATYESVAIPEYRFLVSERPSGKLLQALVPKQSRVTTKKACLLYTSPSPRDS